MLQKWNRDQFFLQDIKYVFTKIVEMEFDINFDKFIEKLGDNIVILFKSIMKVVKAQKGLNIFYKHRVDPVFDNFNLFGVHFDFFHEYNKS